MSALFPAPAPTSGVRWTDLPIPLHSALPSCCLSYKQSAFFSPLCFHNLTNCFSRKPFVLITIQIARGVPLQIPVSLHKSHHPNSQAASFQQLAASFSLLAPFFELVSFVFRDLQPLFENTGVGCLRSVPSVSLWQIHSLSLSIFRLGIHPMLDVRLEETQRDRALLQDGVVEGADIEFGAEAALGFGAQLADFELAEFVGQRLAGPDDVAVDLNRDVLICLAGVVLEKLDGLLA